MSNAKEKKSQSRQRPSPKAPPFIYNEKLGLSEHHGRRGPAHRKSGVEECSGGPLSSAVFKDLRKIYKIAAMRELPGPEPPQRGKPVGRLSEMDKKIIEALLQPDGKDSSVELEKKLGIPRRAIQRRREYLERGYLEFRYVLDLSRLGFRRVNLFINTAGGEAGKVAKELMERDEVVHVGTSVREHTVDLRAEILVRDNLELLDVLERVKAMPGVRDVVWSEIVQVLGRKLSIPALIVDKM